LSKREREGRQMVKVGGKKEMIARSVWKVISVNCGLCLHFGYQSVSMKKYDIEEHFNIHTYESDWWYRKYISEKRQVTELTQILWDPYGTASIHLLRHEQTQFLCLNCTAASTKKVSVVPQQSHLCSRTGGIYTLCTLWNAYFISCTIFFSEFPFVGRGMIKLRHKFRVK
jgi:hypothetical protein